MPTLDNPETALISASTRLLPTFELGAAAIEAKEKALTQSALIARVVDADSKIIAVRAQQSLKRVVSDIEKARKELKEPLLIAGRQLDALCAKESIELNKEFGRVSELVAEFDNAERRRVIEEERLQRLELERIEREKQAELKRIADEQAAAERKAREEIEAAAKLAAEATNKKQREAAEKARIEALRLAAEAAAKLAAHAANVEEKAGDAAYAAARPIEITRVQGQHTAHEWEITKINEWALMKGRPDLVRKIEFDMRAIKDELKRGVKLPGVEAREVFKADVRVGKLPEAISV